MKVGDLIAETLKHVDGSAESWEEEWSCYSFESRKKMWFKHRNGDITNINQLTMVV